VGANGDALRLFVTEDAVTRVFGRQENVGGASFPQTRTAATYDAILAIDGNNAAREVPLPALTATFPMVEMFSDGSILVVAPRCEFRAGQGELNAGVYNAGGAKTEEFLRGDGIQHVQVDRQDRIWVGYFDEGVYGNFGWGAGDGPPPTGASGLACFNRIGTKLWEYEAPEELGPIDDCYALNVSELGTWAYYYSDFPLVRVDQQTMGVTAWRTPGDGGSAFATDGKRALLYGGYDRQKNPCRLLDLKGNSADLIAEVSLAVPEGAGSEIIIGRGKQLHFVGGDDWHVFSVDAVP